MRTGKVGLDYFPLDVDFFDDEKIEFTSAIHGVLSELITIKLLGRIYRNGYYIEWSDDTCILFAKKFGEDITHELLKKVIDELINRKFFNKKLFSKYSILTSSGIQKRYLKATERRKSVDIFKEYLCLSEHDVYILNKNVNILNLNDDISTQRKGKERKEKGKNTVEKPENVTEQTWDDFLSHRKKKNADLTQTALNRIISQAEKAGWNLEDAISEMVSRGWTGFNSDWVNKKTKKQDVFNQEITKSIHEIKDEAKRNKQTTI